MRRPRCSRGRWASRVSRDCSSIPRPRASWANCPGVQHGRQKEGGGAAVHFPDGNATVARLLVRWLVPDAVPGKTMEDVGAARVNYALLDRASQPARIRLNSTVLNVRHDGDPAQAPAKWWSATAAAEKCTTCAAKACVMACWNMFIPYLVPELPGDAEGSAGVRGERSAGLHQRRREELEGVAEARRQLHQCAHHVPPGSLAYRGGFARRLETSANARRSRSRCIW